MSPPERRQACTRITQQNLINAFGGESMARMRYLHFGRQAEKETFPNIARLLYAIFHAELCMPATIIAKFATWRAALWLIPWAFGPGDTVRNLKLAIAGEEYEITEERFTTFS